MMKLNHKGVIEILLFDTSTCIQFLKGDQSLSFVDTPIAISVISVFELLPTARRRSKKVHQEVSKFIDKCRILDVSLNISKIAADAAYDLTLRGKPKSMADLLIAASGIVHKIKLITYDKDFSEISESMNLDLLLLEVV
jgi:predicted nucleic acid-binding protein